MTLDAESSAVLAWLLDEGPAADIRQALSAASMVLASDLTLIECDRVIHRALALRELTEAEAADRHAHLATAALHWHLLRVGPDVVDRARQPFPGDPVRSLDALHLASALVARSAVPGLAVLSLDTRIRRVATLLGFTVWPTRLGAS